MDFLYIILWAFLGIWSLANLTSFVGLVGLLLFLALTLIASLAAYRGSRPFTTAAPVFFASRWSKNNLLFPTQVAVQPTQVIRHRKKPIGAQEEAINITQIASVKIDTGLLWSNVIIESTGGANPIVCHGHLNADVDAILSESDPKKAFGLVQDLQRLVYAEVPLVKIGEYFILHGSRKEVKGYASMLRPFFFNVWKE